MTDATTPEQPRTAAGTLAITCRHPQESIESLYPLEPGIAWLRCIDCDTILQPRIEVLRLLAEAQARPAVASCEHPGCGLPDHLHGSPIAGERATIATHRFQAAGASERTLADDEDAMREWAKQQAPAVASEGLRAAVELTLAERPSPNVEGCTCDRDDHDAPEAPLVMCEMHERMLRPLRWDTLAMMVIDLGAAITEIKQAARAALSVTPPTDSGLREALERLLKVSQTRMGLTLEQWRAEQNAAIKQARAALAADAGSVPAGFADPHSEGYRAGLSAGRSVGALDVEAASLAQRITDAVNAGERPVSDMDFASILHGYAHQVADDRDDAADAERQGESDAS